MLYGNTMFEIVLDSYMADKEKVSKIKEIMGMYETKMRKRTPLQDIGKTKTFNEVLNDSIDFISYADYMSSWTEQVMLTVKAKKDTIQKKYELEVIKVNKQLEMLQEIQECTSKTEKQKLKEKLLKENTIILEHQLDDVKNHLDFCKIFCEDAKRSREFAYAYFQGVKRVGGEV